MSEFVYLFRTNPGERQMAMGSPEAAKKSMESWLAWIRELEASGNLKDAGQPLDTSGRVVRGRNVTDGPFAEAKDLVLGFMVVRARDLAHAVELSKGCPMLGGNGSVEVRPVARF